MYSYFKEVDHNYVVNLHECLTRSCWTSENLAPAQTPSSAERRPGHARAHLLSASCLLKNKFTQNVTDAKTDNPSTKRQRWQ